MRVYREEQKRPVSASAVVRLVIWSVVLCVLVALFTVGMTAPSEGWFAGFNLGGFRYDDSGYSIGNGTSSEPITAISVEWVAGSVTVVPSEGDEISISEDYAGENRDLALRWKIEDGELSVKYRAPAWIVNQAVDKNLTLAIPAAMLENMADVEIMAVDGSITYNGNADELSLEAVDGEIAVNGDIGELDIEGVNMQILFRGAVRKADVECVDATVDMYLDMATELSFDLVDGDIAVYLSEEITGFSVEMDALSKGVDAEGFDGLQELSRGNTRWGDGRLRILVDGVDADVKIRKLTEKD
jgi:hypothetical protein